MQGTAGLSLTEKEWPQKEGASKRKRNHSKKASVLASKNLACSEKVQKRVPGLGKNRQKGKKNCLFERGFTVLR